MAPVRTALLVILALVVVAPVSMAGHTANATDGYLQFDITGARYVTLGYYPGIMLNVTNYTTEPQNIVVIATFGSGSATYVAFGSAGIGVNQTDLVFALDLQPIPAGTYEVSFVACNLSSGLPVSTVTTPVSITVPP